MDLSLLGLLLIIIGWSIQLFYISKKKNQIQPLFLVSYSLGVAILVIDGVNSGLACLAAMNIVSLILAVIVFLFLLKPKKKPRKRR